ncbi:MAG: FAD-dependent oxidoreductase, partial [Lentisphaeria bacterium]|nr:FAD-dependent oxidoreductase [Lentisphaeria bacterium]
VCALERHANRLTHALVENKSGRQAISAQIFIDATGDADLCHLAGEETESLDSNVPCGWFYYLLDGTLHLDKCSHAFSPDLTREDGNGPFFRGDDSQQVTGMILASRNLLRQRLAELRQRNPSADIQMLAPPTIPCFRATRRLVAQFSLTADHAHHWFDDTCGLISDWRKPGPVWSIPWRCLSAANTSNLAVAGRCISAATSVWDVTRALPGCAVTGEAAGTAAALAVRQCRADLHRLTVAHLQETLRQNGALLDAALIQPPEAT